ncbi:MAG: hypothetical protein ACREBW_03875 [Candidatus Micrarchaeaceae archaeon]
MSRTRSEIFTKRIADIMVKPCGQEHVTLGYFTAAKPAKGFAIELHAKQPIDESVVAEIMNIGTDSKYRLVLSIANYSDAAVQAKVWGMP